MVIYRLYDGRSEVDMQECRNWQTSKTKDLVINAIVWVQVPSPACQAFTGSCKCLFIISQEEAVVKRADFLEQETHVDGEE